MKVYYLGSCSTCQLILKEAGLNQRGFTLQDIKTDPLTPNQLDALRALSGSYASLVSRRAINYRQLGLHEQQLTEADYRRLILEEYTFLKRPVIEYQGRLFIGSEKKTVAALQDALNA